jgi:FdhE protein
MVSARRDDIQTRLLALQQQYPEWQSVLTIWAESLGALDDPLWQAAVPQPCADRPAAAPLLAGVTLDVDARRVQRWVDRLVTVVGKHAASDTPTLGKSHFSQETALALLEAALCQNQTHLTALASAAGLHPQVLTSLAHLAVLPLLQACGQCLASQVSPTWSYAYCPICSAWPALAEIRGLEQARRLRCGRCGADWSTAWLHCAYCGEGDHRRLGVLRPEAEGETRTVETCATCKGYLKTRATLQALPAYIVALEDLATVALDMAALERGFTRPSPPGYALASRLTARPWRRRTVFGWRI